MIHILNTIFTILTAKNEASAMQGTIFQIPTLNSGMRNAQSIGFISELAKNNVSVAQEIYRCKENFGTAMI